MQYSLRRPRLGVIGLPGKWSTEVLADSVERQTGFRLIIDMQRVRLDLSANQLFFGENNLCELDGLLVKKISEQYSPNTIDRLELLRIAEACGVRVFSPAEKIIRLIDRLSCTVTLRNHGIPVPPTIVTEDEDAALQAIQEYNSAVFKPLYSTKARGMLVIDSTQPKQRQLEQIRQFRKNSPMMYIQQKLQLPGQDLGMVFLGGNYLGAYARVSHSSAWNTTINSGGKYAEYNASEQLIALARKAQQPFGLDFTTVDVAETALGPVVFEVSAFGGFRGAKEGLGIDAASQYVDYALAKLKQGEMA